MANIEFKTQFPDWKVKRKDLERELLKAAGESFNLIVEDNVRRIRGSVDQEGNAQKQNAPATKARKLKKRGHTIPLRDKDVLSDKTKWRIGQVPFNIARSNLRQAFSNLSLTLPINVPKKREDIIPYLNRLGYRPPIGVSTAILKQTRDRFEAAFARAFRGR